MVDGRLHQTLRLADGRTLGYADFGEPAGSPVVYQHGWPGSRLDIVALDDVASDSGVRIVAPDRPGFGLSDHYGERTLLDWPDDVAQLADSLELDQFGVLGLSGGGPSALAIAHRLSARVTSIAMVSAWGPMGRRELLAGVPWSDRIALELAARIPWANRPYTGLMALSVRLLSPDRLLRLVASSLNESDKELLAAGPDLGPRLVASAKEAFRRGGAAAATDIAVTARPWGFEASTVTSPVRFFHGSDDPAVPIGISELLSREIPGATLEIYPGEGHLAIYRHAAEILRTLRRR